MKAKIYIPYANGDCVKGFRYEGKHLTKEEYADMVDKDYNKYKHGVDEMVSERLGYNIAINPYQKYKRKYTQQTYYFHECPCNLYDIDTRSFSLSELDELHRNKQKFVMIVYLDSKTVSTTPDLETDLKEWLKESLKIKNLDSLSDEEVLMHLPKKDFKIYIEEDKSTAVLKDCKLLDRIGTSNVRFALLVEKIVFVKG